MRLQATTSSAARRDHQRRMSSAMTNRQGVMNSTWRVDVIMPPMLGAAIGFMISMPGPDESGMSDSDNLIQFPMGAGIAYRDAIGITLDVRGTFRAASDSELVLDPASGTYAPLHSWEASAALGYEF